MHGRRGPRSPVASCLPPAGSEHSGPCRMERHEPGGSPPRPRHASPPRPDAGVLLGTLPPSPPGLAPPDSPPAATHHTPASETAGLLLEVSPSPKILELLQQWTPAQCSICLADVDCNDHRGQGAHLSHQFPTDFSADFSTIIRLSLVQLGARRAPSQRVQSLVPLGLPGGRAHPRYDLPELPQVNFDAYKMMDSAPKTMNCC